MRIELSCTSCLCHFAASPETSPEELYEQMFDEGPKFCLGDGETFEDMIFATLTTNGNIHCPECGQAVGVSEESLGQWALELLASW
jgi:hypothetical protein